MFNMYTSCTILFYSSYKLFKYVMKSRYNTNNMQANMYSNISANQLTFKHYAPLTALNEDGERVLR